MVLRQCGNVYAVEIEESVETVPSEASRFQLDDRIIYSSNFLLQMLFKQISLNNIRSYIDETIKFPEGSVLLSGDIGSGKSTILYALEFALFGTEIGTGEALLRKGSKQGSVELIFELNGKEYSIRRSLKMVADKIMQKEGYLIVDGERKEGMGTELKAQILDLLNYPKDMQSKKSLVYRYTVYTPQEHMKKILLDKKEDRLDTLRKVFGIDKYQKIKENAIIYAKSIKDEINFLKAQILDLDAKLEMYRAKNEKVIALENEIKEILPKLSETKKELENHKKIISNLEKQQKLVNEEKNRVNLLSNSLVEKRTQLNRTEDEKMTVKLQISKLNEQISSLKNKNVESPLHINFENEKTKLKQTISKLESDMYEINNCIKGFEVNIDLLNERNNNVLKLSKCPTCEQIVSDNHKHNYLGLNNTKINEFRDELDLCKKKKEFIENEMKKAKTEFEKISIDEIKNSKVLQEIRLKEMQLQGFMSNLETTNKRYEQIEKTFAEITSNMQILTEQILQLNEKIKQFPAIDDEKIISAKNVLDELNSNLKNLEIKKAKTESEKQTISKDLSDLEKEIEDKKIKKEKISLLRLKYDWIDEFFVKLMYTIEKGVLFQVHGEFNSLFKEWFNMLIPEENLSIRLDNEFTPIISQNGHEIDLEHMSGGEKTAISLTYRLALNKVINNLMSNIKTSDILILDEPTDGFSNEMLDKVRDVLDELNLKQVIIVSHESKIESFVDNCIKISKEEHVSRVVESSVV